MLKLIYTNASPYARKARITALEAGIDLDLVFSHPTADDSKVPDFNPLGKVPALILDDGTLIVDSPVICEFLDQHERAPTLLPAAGPERIRVRTIEALADGIMDATVSRVLEMRRDPSERSPYWLARWEEAIRRTLPALEAHVTADQGFHLGTIAAICALDYLDFRFPDLEALAQLPALRDWFEGQKTRQSVRATEAFDGPSR